MPETLIETAQQAGLKDLDVLKLAKPNLPHLAAIADLRTRFPDAFPKQTAKRGQDMTPAELKAGMARINAQEFQRSCKALDASALVKFRKQFGMKD